MKFISFFPIMIVLVSGHYQQYLQDPFVTKLDGRSFGLFNMLNRNVDKTRLANLEATIATLQPQVSSLNSQFATAQASNIPVQSAIQAQVVPLLTRLTAAEALINTAQNNIASLGKQLAAVTTPSVPACPAAATAIGALMVNGKCLSVEGSDTGTPTTLLNFAAASTSCTSKGGTLAEPSASDVSFWTNLNSVFPTKVAGLSTSGMFVGVTSNAAVAPAVPVFSYLSGSPISNSAAVWAGKNPTAIPTPLAGTAAFVRTTSAASGTWLNAGTTANDLTSTLRGFICQF